MPTSIGTTGVTFPDATVQTTAATGGGFSGATTNAVGSSAITLTSSSTQYQVAQINSYANSTVNLPNATTLSSKGFAPYVIENQSPIGANLAVKDFAGTIVGYIPAGQVGLVALSANATSAGVWAISLTQPQGFISYTPDSANINTGMSATNYVGLSSTTFVRAYANFYYSNPNYYITMYTQVGTISGNTITYGSVQTNGFQSGPAPTGLFYFNVIRLSNTTFIARATDNNGTCCGYNIVQSNFKVCSVSGTTVTFGTQYALNSQNSTSGTQDGALAANGNIVRLSDTSLAYFYNNATTASYPYPYNYSGSLFCRIGTVSGTSVTFGTAVALGSSTYAQVNSTVALSASSILVCYGQASAGSNFGRTKLVVVSVSGTTATWGTPVTVESVNVPNSILSTLNLEAAVAPSASQALFNAGYFIGECTVSGTTPTFDSYNYTNPTGVLSVPLYLCTSTKAWSPATGLYFNIKTSGAVVQPFTGINQLDSHVTLPAPKTPLGAQPTTTFLGTASGGANILGNTL